MGEIATSYRQITLYYSSDSVRAKQTIAYAKTEGFIVQEVDILKEKLTGTQIIEVADLGCRLGKPTAPGIQEKF